MKDIFMFIIHALNRGFEGAFFYFDRQAATGHFCRMLGFRHWTVDEWYTTLILAFFTQYCSTGYNHIIILCSISISVHRSGSYPTYRLPNYYPPILPHPAPSESGVPACLRTIDQSPLSVNLSVNMDATASTRPSGLNQGQNQPHPPTPVTFYDNIAEINFPVHPASRLG